MKKILGIEALALIAAIFTGCSSLGAAMSTSTKNIEEYQEAVGTPSDSVIFYGIFNCNEFQSFSQMDPDFPPDYQEMEKGIFISKPVAPGSTYILESSRGEEYAGNWTYTWDHTYSMQTPINPVIINIPKKPGFYYVGWYEGRDLASGKSERKWLNYDVRNETMCLKGALKLYKGTAWEEAINNRLEELKNEK